MAYSRYIKDSRISAGSQLGVNESLAQLRFAIKQGVVRIQTVVIATGDDRLDTLAGQIYGESRYWWALAAASDIGWGLQIPPGTVISVPNMEDVLSIVR